MKRRGGKPEGESGRGIESKREGECDWRWGKEWRVFSFFFSPDKSDMTSQITPSSRNNFLSLGEERPCPSLPECVGSAAFLMKEAFGMLILGIN